MVKPELSIIIVSYNTKELLVSCIKSIEKYIDIPSEVLISDNGSSDGTIEALKSLKVKGIEVKVIENDANLGFAKGNNIGRNMSRGKYILFLNPDTLFHERVVADCIKYIEKQENIGAITCKVSLPNGKLDPDTRRSFPTPFVALTHFSGLDRLFPASEIFSRYWYGFKSDTETHEIDALQGAFLLTKKDVLDKVGWFDEDYFLDGEDIDLCWKIKDAGYKIIYFPKGSIIHIKKGSKSKNRSLRSITGGVNAMEIFYKKRLWSVYPIAINIMVLLSIKLLKLVRITKYYLL